MTLLLSITVAVLFGAGCYLAVKADLLRVVATMGASTPGEATGRAVEFIA